MTNFDSAWSDFWSEGNLSSLNTTFDDGYDGSIKQMWNDSFVKLDDNARLLDLCSGNGSILKLAIEFCQTNEKSLELNGIEAAKVSESTIQELKESHQGIFNFYSETKVEKFVSEKQYSLVTSQYGIEYTDWSETLPLVANLLKQDGEAAFFIHTDSSIVYNIAQDELVQFEKIMSLKFFVALKKLVREMGDLTRPEDVEKLKQSKKADKYRNDVNEILAQLQELAGAYQNANIIYNCFELVNAIMKDKKQESAKDKEVFIKKTQQQLEHNAQRLQNMVDSTLTRMQREEFINMAKSAGLELTFSQDVLEKGFVVGHQLKFNKS
ncbi:hypothetical protein [Pleionea sp. CnH1-48]|uniref:hypothetical protein n=1 Tax=Pleionea sp. CnH1-48 TaxID=2954494 RepID=UPI002097F7A9|nr:hypothetical protein [Pleionea sp. CnH1-48]MCO7225023.1 hypothetical protein [Pleionea sp. CnH1-48]